ncbi:MAG: PTS sugar transporter subunit IIC [Lachnospiraceae bacterium]|jgi:PTS system cellobiose-specific IIC component|nr:PTS sugar transporter subunit IIC [Lachnospiraceae bacterium]
MGNAIERLADSKFMKNLQKMSMKLTKNEIFATISSGMGATMGLIMIGAVIQVICALGSLIFKWDTSSPSYAAFYMPYKLTMGLLGFFMCFSMAYNYAKRKKRNPMQAGFTAIVCYILVVSPVVSASVDGGATFFDALNLGNLGTGGMFVALIIGLCSVAISEFAIRHNWLIKLPDVVPEGIANSFNAIIPTGINIVVWYGLSILIAAISQGSLTLASLITKLLGIPIGYLTSAPGMFIIIILCQFFWFFGIHGTGVIFNAILIPYVTAYSTNSALAAAGQPLQWSPLFIFGALSIMGGTGNTLPLCVMGLKSKSKRISAVSKAALGPGIFNINEPAIFGFPIMYNSLMLIPFILCPLVVAALMLIAYSLGLMAYPQVLIMTTLPVVFSTFMSSLDWRNCVFAILMFPVCYLVYLPFFKVYEKQCIEQEAAEEAAQ